MTSLQAMMGPPGRCWGSASNLGGSGSWPTGAGQALGCLLNPFIFLLPWLICTGLLTKKPRAGRHSSYVALRGWPE